jgi:hypothetical protein
MINNTDKITKLADATGWKFMALRKKTINAIKEYRAINGVDLKTAKDCVRAWQEWVFTEYPHWEWMIWAIGADSDVQTAAELFLKIAPNDDMGIGWHRDQVVAFQEAWHRDGAAGWGVGVPKKDRPTPSNKITGSVEQMRAALQKRG